MARIILVLGDEGTGKTTGLRNLPPEQSYLITPNNKPLPWRGSKKMFNEERGNIYRTREFDALGAAVLKVSDDFLAIKYLVIDDYSHWFTARTLSTGFLAQTSGGAAFSRYNKLAADIYNSLWSLESQLREDLTIIVNTHTELRNDGQVIMKTPGNLVDRDVKPASIVTYVLHTIVTESKDPTNKYFFLTNKDGVHAAKTPMGCFEQELVPNDIFACINTIEAYENGE